MLGKRSSIMIFIRDLPANLTPKELKAFVLTGVRAAPAGFAAGKGTIASCTILRMSDPKSGAEEYHGLVEVQPAKAAIHAISELNGRAQRTEAGGSPLPSPLGAARSHLPKHDHDPPTGRRRRGGRSAAQPED